MDSNIESALITALIGGLLSGLLVALLSHFLTRRKTEAEIRQMEANTEKTWLQIERLRSEMDEVQTKVKVIDRLRLGNNGFVVLKEEQKVLGVRREKE
jgi:hypothetical protein